MTLRLTSLSRHFPPPLNTNNTRLTKGRKVKGGFGTVLGWKQNKVGGRGLEQAEENTVLTTMPKTTNRITRQKAKELCKGGGNHKAPHRRNGTHKHARAQPSSENQQKHKRLLDRREPGTHLMEAKAADNQTNKQTKPNQTKPKASPPKKKKKQAEKGGEKNKRTSCLKALV